MLKDPEVLIYHTDLPSEVLVCQVTLKVTL